MSPQKEAQILTILGIAGLLGLLYLTLHGVALGVTALACGGAALAGGPTNGLLLLFTGQPHGYSTGTACAVPTTAIQVVDVVAVVVLVGAAALLLVWWLRYRQSDAWFINDIKRRSGFASGGEIAKHLSAKATVGRAGVLRPTLQSPQAADVSWTVGLSKHQAVHLSIEDSVVLEGAPRSGKGFRIIVSSILDWSGPLITTSTRNDNLLATYAERKKRGEVTVFDPQGLAGIRSTLRISPMAGCEDALTADQRAQSIISGTKLGASASNGEWADAASAVLAQLLHAAAVSGADVASLYRWGSNPALASEAVEVLDLDGAPGWGDSLRAVIDGDEKMRANTWFGVQSAVRPLAIPEIQEALRPRTGEAFDADAFLAGENTLYLIGTGAGAGSMGGFLGAVLDDVVNRARVKANASASARLDPPLGLILDEIANMFYWKQLPTVMADGGGIGISTMVVLQALSQAETAWSRAEMDTIWSAATAKLILGGASDVAHLRDVSALMGERNVRKQSYSYSRGGSSSSEQTDRQALMGVDEIRRMPETMGLLAYRNRRPVLLDLQGWIERRDAKLIQEGKRATEAEARLVFAERAAAARPSAPNSAASAPEPTEPAEH